MVIEYYPVGHYWTVPLQQLMWVVETFGTSGNRWMVQDEQLCFYNEQDRSLFLLRWV
jgi:hypothetical protein